MANTTDAITSENVRIDENHHHSAQTLQQANNVCDMILDTIETLELCYQQEPGNPDIISDLKRQLSIHLSGQTINKIQNVVDEQTRSKLFIHALSCKLETVPVENFKEEIANIKIVIDTQLAVLMGMQENETLKGTSTTQDKKDDDMGDENTYTSTQRLGM